MPQAKTRVLRARVPARMMGKRDGLFFLWGEIERARLKAESALAPEAAASDGTRAKRAGSTKGSLQVPTDEFIFY
ncbi:MULTISPECIES: hypothetical protein [unclassified Ruegeria]|uniref:hypothetical protein n=1 Tax=unclassified Ruegeria TaxID=2625375 RepID=UPI0014887F62|nr:MULTISPECIES: hypothetical protein [unclassified Ruegeria]NOD90164.1 hypothetical protein [Ruegeria sp. HKCCD4318]NOE15237.1 hypothetical protein [Ruegeria sp. HKCCD4318-2]NOG10553.1 hypothetical protein [Ruegeria sp. HKCCD4315]